MIPPTHPTPAVEPFGSEQPAVGLSSAAARALLTEHGPNALPEPKRERGLARLARQFRSPLIYILLLAVAIDLLVFTLGGARGVPGEAIAITVILLLNAILGAWQERKAEDALRRLEDLAAPRVWTHRDGSLQRIPARDVVPGDLIRLGTGDRMPADGRIERAANLAVDESVLTGESLPVDKIAGVECLAGTLVVRGTVSVLVTRTGSGSALGQLAGMLGTVETEPTPLERRLDAFGRRVARWVLVLAAAIMVGGVWAEGLEHGAEVFLFAVALAVAVVPEGLPAVLTITLALGVERMARRRAVVRRLAAVESLGSVTVIATDKTGTLTENRMEIRMLDTPDDANALLTMALANEADLGGEAGDPVDLAFLRHLRAVGTDPAQVRGRFVEASRRAFDSEHKFMRVTGRLDGQVATFAKGAPEVILARCNLSPDERTTWLHKTETHATDGYRLIGMAWGVGSEEEQLTWLGLALLWDPPRPEVREALARARDAGIRVLMLTGDHPATAAAVARAIGVPGETVITGDQVAAATDDALRELLARTHVFARISPADKLRIVEALQRSGEIVAMTGDGVNDAPALKRADVGIAMGQRGSDVSREVADLVLLDDNFATIVAAIEEGRGIYENIQKFVRFLFSTNLSEVLVVTVGAMAAVAFGLRDSAGDLLLPLTAAQLLWINLVTDGAPALALGVDRNPGGMNAPPRPPASPLLDRISLRFVTVSGTIKAAVALTLLGLLPWLLRASWDETQTAVFLFMAVGQLLYVYPARHTAVRPPANRLVHLAVAGSAAAQVAVVAVPALMVMVGATALRASGWLAVGVAVVFVWMAAEFTTRMVYRRDAR